MTMAEFWALRNTLNISHIEIKSDSLAVVSLLDSLVPDRHPFSNFIFDCTKKFEGVKLCHKGAILQKYYKKLNNCIYMESSGRYERV